ncbi:S-layer homology domain-containing protein [Anaerovorax sp. IOR16]|uniref:S-layer homology domain-containing protein n=1 Tax=Anaerovorax sp. IOR16 TaxID=2773458 RepID=UPI0019CF9FD0|nr:S-layer homology domain-containing protein [Anaerovorax sp. IOR16]
MKKTRARFLSILLTVCMVLSLMPTVAFATEGGVTGDTTAGTSTTTYTISGTVSDGSGVLADATVQLLNHQNTPVGSAVTTDTDGNYTIGSVETGWYTIEVSKVGYTTVNMGSFQVYNTDITGKDTTLDAIIVTYTVSGTVRNADGTLSGASVQLKNLSNNNVGSAVTTDASGNYTIPGVAPGDYTIEISKEGYITATIETFDVTDADITDKDIALVEMIGEEITTAAELKSELEKTAPATINVAADITMSGDINVGADHTLNIAAGKTVSTADSTLGIPEGKTLTLAGTGTLNANGTASRSDISVSGTLKLSTDSKLSVTNSGNHSKGISLLSSGSLISEGGIITLSNSAGNGVLAQNGVNVTLDGGSLTVANSGVYGMGISTADMTVSNGCVITIENGGDATTYGIAVPSLSLTDSTVRIVNTAGIGINVVGSSMTLDNSTASVAASGGTGILIDDSTTLTGTNNGKLTLYEGAKLQVGAGVLSDRGYIYQNNDVVTVAAASEEPATGKITAGDYIWKDTTFYKGVTVSTYTVSGTVSDVNSALAGASVQLKNSSNENVGSAVTTDNSGRYTISDVGNGTSYVITVSKAGYKTGYINYFDVNGANVTGKDITLQPFGTASYVLKLGDTALDADSTTAISGSGYSYLYDSSSDSGTLTLNGYTNSTIGTTTDSDDYVVQSALFANFPLTIVLQGENNLHSSNTTDAESAGIYIDNAPLTIRGSGTLYAFGDDAAGNGSSSYGIYAEDLSVEGGTIHAQNGNADIGKGAIHCGDITVIGGTVFATGMVVGISCTNLTVSDTGNIEGRSRTVVGIEARGTLTVSGEAIVRGAGGGVTGADCNSIGIDANAITLSDNGIIVGTGGIADGDGAGSYGVYADTSITVNGGRLTGKGGNGTGTDSKSYGVFLFGFADPDITGGEIVGIAGEGTDTSAGLSVRDGNSGVVLYVSQNRDGSDLIELPSGENIKEYPYAVNYIPVLDNYAFYRDGVKLGETTESIKIPTVNQTTIYYQYKDFDQFDMPMDSTVTWEHCGNIPKGVTVGAADTSGIPVTVSSGASTGFFGLNAKKGGTTVGLTINIVDKVDVSGDITFADGSAIYTGSGLTHETTVFNGTESGTGSFTYTYTVPIGSTGDLNTDGKPLGAGSYNVTAVYEDDTQKGEKTALFTVNKATPVIIGVDVVNDTIYPTTLIVVLSHTDGIEGNLALTDGQTLMVGTKDYNWTFTPTDTDNYNPATGTISITVVEDSIVTLEVTTPPTKTTYKHGETLDKTGMVLRATHESGSYTFVGHNDMTVTYQNGSSFSTGDTSVTLGYGGETVTQAVTVGKADYTGMKTVSDTVVTGGETNATLTLPALPDGASYGTPTDGGGAITMTAMSVANGVLNYTSPASTSGQTGTITIPVTGATYYNDYSVTVTVTSTDKALQDISYAVGSVSKTYGEIYTNELTKTTVNGDITYASDDTAVATVNRNTGEVTLKGAGTATITATAQETATHAEATASYTITVAKRAILVKPRDFTIKSNENMPTFDWTIFGIAANDNLVPTNPDAIAMQAQENGVPLTTVKVGTFDIVFTTPPSFTEADMKNYNITFGTGTLTVTQYNSGGGGSGGGGSTGGGSNTTVTTPPSTTENPNPPTEVIVAVKPAVSGDTVSADVSEKTVDNAITKAQAEAKKNGTTDNGIMVEIKVDTKNTKAENITTGLPKESVDALVNAGAKELRITSEIADISLNLDTLKEIQKQVGADVKVTAKKMDNNTLSSEAKKIVGNRPVYDFAITGTNGKKVTDFGSGSVSVSIPYTLGANENAANVVAYYIDSNGNITEMPNSVYDPVTKTLSFVTDHFSKFAVGYKAINVKFTDITNHWAKDSIEFVAARGLLKGTGDNKFSPNTSMTRGMFVTALGRLAEIDPAKYTKSSFTDVKADAYYMPYVEWASKNGIVNGIGDGKFAPEQSITREQMAVIMANYAKVIGFELSKVHAENIFADSAKISSYAKDAVKAMQMAGVLAGKNGNKFDPQGTATRAEVSAVLKCIL